MIAQLNSWRGTAKPCHPISSVPRENLTRSFATVTASGRVRRVRRVLMH
jgi:hypothetical protein